MVLNQSELTIALKSPVSCCLSSHKSKVLRLCLDLAKSKGFNTGSSGNSPIIPIIVGEPHKAVRLSQLMGKSRINVTPMVYASAPYDASRLRLFITCLHTEAQIQTTIASLSEAIASAH